MGDQICKKIEIEIVLIIHQYKLIFANHISFQLFDFLQLENFVFTVGNGKGQKNEEVKKVPVFKSVAKAEHISFEKDMLFTIPKQFKEAITEYAFHGGWGIKFVKNDLQRVRPVC